MSNLACDKKSVLETLNIDRVLDTDIFIVSYPRSGNTWIRFLIACMMHPDKTLSFRNIDRFIPDVYRHAEYANSISPPRFLKTHHPFYGCFPRFIYIYRDGRDVFVSYYFYMKQRNQVKNGFSEFLRERLIRHPRYLHPWHEHVSKALDFANKFPDRALLLRYEKIGDFAVDYAYKIAEFCRLDVSKKVIENAVKKTSFENLRKVEKEYGPEIEKYPDVDFFRSGRTGQWKEIFSGSDSEFFYSIAGPTMKRLGYV
ncbi:MAG: hypothetical protein A2Z72_01365 [Omnitrophica bacterium RBG_13_46_9]|nr:MAG: hypothetical protein A2Z72_01365 [Omnitrophica bacterium RBG_13_46_9]